MCLNFSNLPSALPKQGEEEIVSFLSPITSHLLSDSKFSDDKRELEGKAWPDHVNVDVCPVRLMLHYEARKSDLQNRPGGPYIITVNQAAERAPQTKALWYNNGPMGVNLIAGRSHSTFCQPFRQF